MQQNPVQQVLEARQKQYQAYQQRLAHIEALVRKFADIAQVLAGVI